jgi:hypothetical protein
MEKNFQILENGNGLFLMQNASPFSQMPINYPLDAYQIPQNLAIFADPK